MPGTMTWENSPHPNMPVGESHPQEWAARKTEQNCNQSRKDSRTDFLRIKQRAAGKKEVEKKRRKEAIEEQGTHRPPILLAGKHPSRRAGKYRFRMPSGKAVSDAVKTKEQEDPGCQGDMQNPEWTGNVGKVDRFPSKDKTRKARPEIPQGRMPSARNSRKPYGSEKPRKRFEPKTIQRRTIKTAPPSVKISIQPEQKLRVASSTLTARMQKQMERRAASRRRRKPPCRLPMESAGYRKRQGQERIPSRQLRPL